MVEMPYTNVEEIILADSVMLFPPSQHQVRRDTGLLECARHYHYMNVRFNFQTGSVCPLSVSQCAYAATWFYATNFFCGFIG